MRVIIIGLICLFTSALSWASGVEEFRSFLGTVKTVQGSFTQTVISKPGRKPQLSSGYFAVSHPGKFRWSYEKPFRQLLVSDGKKMWNYDPDMNQVSIRRLDHTLGSSPAALLAGDNIETNFTLREAGTSDGFQFIEAVPRDKDSTFERIRVGLSDQLPRVLEVRDNFGQITTLRLHEIEMNPVLPSELFRFIPPKGTDVIGE
jgi:outer membrane lipoprotein carrier protein